MIAAAPEYHVTNDRALLAAGALLGIAHRVDKTLTAADIRWLKLASLALGERAGAVFEEDFAHALAGDELL